MEKFRMKKRYLTPIIGIMTFCFLLIPTAVYGSELNFSVTPVIPENQADKQKSYFDLHVKPEMDQMLVIKANNDTDEEVIVEPTIRTATTNMNGVVEYGESNSKPDDTIIHKIEDILVATEKEVKIPAHGSSDISFKLTIPKEKFQGVLAGGITLKEKETKKDEAKKDDKQSLAIENKYAYVVAIVLKEEDTPVKSELKLIDVEPTQNNARNTISATIQNTKPKYMNKLIVKAKVMEKGKKEVMYEATTEEMQMAPNTSFAYPIPLKGEELKPGKYTLDLVAESKGENWHFTKDFEIEKEVADKLNETDVTIKKREPDYTWLYIGIGAAILLVVILIIIYIIRKKLKAKEEELENLRNEMNNVSHDDGKE
ncbi:hypothetical protein RV11_GL001760 [Enterococcus phoeniculicola]|nr:hypothetical protein RV11_GL001760 [Enterococcus phoeniculicola]